VAVGLLGVTVYVPLPSEVKLKLPDASAVVVKLPAPLRVTVAPAPAEAGLIVPEMVYVGATAVAVKFIAVTLAPLSVTAWLPGLKLKPVLLGVTA
jgi:hypothetical protein